MNNNYNVVLIIIDQLIKQRYYILYIIDKNGIIIKVITYLLLNNILKFYDFPLLLILDCDS